MPANFQDLVELMQKLRSPDGCPWDREQTYATLAPMLLEEAYEAFEAVEEAREGQPKELRDELGDLLFQIVFTPKSPANVATFPSMTLPPQFTRRWFDDIRMSSATPTPQTLQLSCGIGKQ